MPYGLDAGEAGGPPGITIPGRIVVHPRQIPKEIPLKTINWAYLSRLGYPDNVLRAVVEDLRDHYINVYVTPSTEVPGAVIGSDGAVKVDFSKLDRSLDLFPDADRYLFFWGLTSRSLERFRRFGPWMSVEWKTRMAEYLAAWVTHLREQGIGYDRFAMYPFDESLCDAFFDLAKFIKETDPQIQVFANSVGRGDRDVKRFADYVDIWCLLETSGKSAGARVVLKARGGKERWRYNCAGDAKSLSPYAYYRLQAWRAWAVQDTGTAFWVYASGRSRGSCNGWDDFSCGHGRWSVVYDGENAPVDAAGEVYVPSRRWEAWRDGVEDYVYLHTLRERVNALRRRDPAAALIREAEGLLDRVVRRVLEDSADPDRAYEARRQITDMIIRLDRVLAGR